MYCEKTAVQLGDGNIFYFTKTNSKGRGRKTWNEWVKDDMKRLGLVEDDGDKWRSLTTGNRPALPQCGNEGVILYGLRSRDVKG